MISLTKMTRWEEVQDATVQKVQLVKDIEINSTILSQSQTNPWLIQTSAIKEQNQAKLRLIYLSI